jgi:U2-associated protein SR140
MIFPKYYTEQLNEIFLKKENEKQSSPTNSSETMEEEEEEDDVDGEPLEEDVDGEPMDEDLDGEPLDEVKSAQQNVEHIQISREEVESLYTNVKDMFSA